MAWCCQSHYLSQRWSNLMSFYGITRPQWITHKNWTDNHNNTTKPAPGVAYLGIGLQCCDLYPSWRTHPILAARGCHWAADTVGRLTWPGRCLTGLRSRRCHLACCARVCGVLIRAQCGHLDTARRDSFGGVWFAVITAETGDLDTAWCDCVDGFRRGVIGAKRGDLYTAWSALCGLTLMGTRSNRRLHGMGRARLPTRKHHTVGSH